MRVVNAIPAVVAAEPGIRTTLDLPLVTGKGLYAPIEGVPKGLSCESDSVICWRPARSPRCSALLRRRSDDPTCTNTGDATECSSPGNVEINDTPPVVEFTLPYWDEAFGGAYPGPYPVPYDEGSGEMGRRLGHCHADAAAAAAIAALGIAAVVVAPAAAALPDCGTIAPWTMQCERGTHTSINSSPNVIVNTGPFLEQPWLYPGYPVFGIGGWAVP